MPVSLSEWRARIGRFVHWHREYAIKERKEKLLKERTRLLKILHERLLEKRTESENNSNECEEKEKTLFNETESNCSSDENNVQDDSSVEDIKTKNETVRQESNRPSESLPEKDNTTSQSRNGESSTPKESTRKRKKHTSKLTSRDENEHRGSAFTQNQTSTNSAMREEDNTHIEFTTKHKNNQTKNTLLFFLLFLFSLFSSFFIFFSSVLPEVDFPTLLENSRQFFQPVDPWINMYLVVMACSGLVYQIVSCIIHIKGKREVKSEDIWGNNKQSKSNIKETNRSSIAKKKKTRRKPFKKKNAPPKTTTDESTISTSPTVKERNISAKGKKHLPNKRSIKENKTQTGCTTEEYNTQGKSAKSKNNTVPTVTDSAIKLSKTLIEERNTPTECYSNDNNETTESVIKKRNAPTESTIREKNTQAKSSMEESNTATRSSVKWKNTQTKSTLKKNNTLPKYFTKKRKGPSELTDKRGKTHTKPLSRKNSTATEFPIQKNYTTTKSVIKGENTMTKSSLKKSNISTTSPVTGKYTPTESTIKEANSRNESLSKKNKTTTASLVKGDKTPTYPTENKNKTASGSTVKGKKLRTKSTIKVNNAPIKSIENSVRTESTENNIPTESIENNVPTESTENNVPTESTENSLPTESKENNVPTESTENVTIEFRENNVPNEFTENNITTESTEDNIPTESTGKNPSTECKENISTESTENSIPAVSTENSIPTEPTENIPTESTENDFPTGSTANNIPSESTENSIPTESTENNPSTESTEKSIPTECTENNITTESTENISTESTENNIPSESTENISTESTENNIPTESTENISTESTENNIPSESTENNITTQSTENNISTESTENSIPTESTENISTESTENNIPTESTENNITTQSTENNPSTESTENNISTESTENNIPTESAENNNLTESTENSIPTESTENNVSTASSEKNLSTESTIKENPIPTKPCIIGIKLTSRAFVKEEGIDDTKNIDPSCTEQLLIQAGDVEMNPGPLERSIGGLQDRELLKLADNVSPEYYYTLGIALGFSQARSKTILTRNLLDVHQATFEMLCDWRMKQSDGSECRRVLVEILRKEELKMLADIISKGTYYSEEGTLPAPEGGGRQPLTKEQVARCGEDFKTFYRTRLCKIKTDPIDFTTIKEFEDIYTDLVLLRNGGGRHQRDQDTIDTKKPLKYHELLTTEVNGEFPKRLMVEGEGGAGKTTLCSKIAWDWTNGADQFKEFDWVLFIPLCEIETDQTVGEIAKTYLSDGNSVQPCQIDEYILVNPSKVFIIFDGLDEYDGDLVKESSDIARIVKHEKFRECRVLITTRPWKADQIKSNTTFRRIYAFIAVTGFDKEHISVYINKYFSDDAHAGRELIRLIESNDVIKENMAPYPIYIAMLCVLWRDYDSEKRELIRRMKTFSQLFQEIMTFLKDHYVSKQFADLNKESITRTHEQLDIYFTQIGHIALTGVTDKKLVFHKNDFSAFEVAMETCCKVGVLSQENRLVRRRDRHRNVTQPMISSVFFPHKLFQEYLAGVYLAYLFESDHESYEEKMSGLFQRNLEEFRYLLYFTASQTKNVGFDIINRLIDKKGNSGSYTNILVDVTFEAYDEEAAKMVCHQIFAQQKSLEISDYMSAHTVSGYLFVMEMEAMETLVLRTSSCGPTVSRELADIICSSTSLTALTISGTKLHADFYGILEGEIKESKLKLLSIEEMDTPDEVQSRNLARFMNTLPALKDLTLRANKFHKCFYTELAEGTGSAEAQDWRSSVCKLHIDHQFCKDILQDGITVHRLFPNLRELLFTTLQTVSPKIIGALGHSSLKKLSLTKDDPSWDDEVEEYHPSLVGDSPSLEQVFLHSFPRLTDLTFRNLVIGNSRCETILFSLKQHQHLDVIR